MRFIHYKIICPKRYFARRTGRNQKVIADESKFFYARNVEKWTNCYRQTPQTYWAKIEKEAGFQKEGWDNILPFVTNYFKENPKEIKAIFKRENYNFRKVNPTYIWATFDQNKRGVENCECNGVLYAF